jgi:hypothetical protein
MGGLNLGVGSKRLPASAFPEWADEYFCDNCGREITKQLRRRESHSWQPMGAERFRCACGSNGLTGAAEWDHLSYHGKRNRINALIVLNLGSLLLASIIGLVGYFLSSEANVALNAGLIALSLFLLFQVRSWFGVSASIWRTRLRRAPANKGS